MPGSVCNEVTPGRAPTFKASSRMNSHEFETVRPDQRVLTPDEKVGRIDDGALSLRLIHIINLASYTQGGYVLVTSGIRGWISVTAAENHPS